MGDTLADAQLRKLAYIVARARISQGHRVLEIGSGWGSMALHIVRNVPDTQVDTITLSDNQCAHVCAEVERLGFTDRIWVHLVDYREMPREWEGLFDRVVSIEMVEAVGLENIEAYWAAIDRVLKKDTGGGAIQGITIPEASQSSLSDREAVTEPLPTCYCAGFPAYFRSMDFIRKWVSLPRTTVPF
jgi:cyclopropane-fatty-acyl-phospholipid synthase